MLRRALDRLVRKRHVALFCSRAAFVRLKLATVAKPLALGALRKAPWGAYVKSAPLGADKPGWAMTALNSLAPARFPSHAVYPGTDVSALVSDTCATFMGRLPAKRDFVVMVTADATSRFTRH